MKGEYLRLSATDRLQLDRVDEHVKQHRRGDPLVEEEAVFLPGQRLQFALVEFLSIENRDGEGRASANGATEAENVRRHRASGAVRRLPEWDAEGGPAGFRSLAGDRRQRGELHGPVEAGADDIEQQGLLLRLFGNDIETDRAVGKIVDDTAAAER
jgi:hypothetical protein